MNNSPVLFLHECLGCHTVILADIPRVVHLCPEDRPRLVSSPEEWVSPWAFREIIETRAMVKMVKFQPNTLNTISGRPFLEPRWRVQCMKCFNVTLPLDDEVKAMGGLWNCEVCGLTVSFNLWDAVCEKFLSTSLAYDANTEPHQPTTP
jgi:hypothetical protein